VKAMRRHRALVRIYVKQDEDDPLLYVVTDDPDEGAIPVIPTQKAHALWTYASPRWGTPSQQEPGVPRADGRAGQRSGLPLRIVGVAGTTPPARCEGVSRADEGSHAGPLSAFGSVTPEE